MKQFDIITIELNGKDTVQLTKQVQALMTGSLTMVGTSYMIDSNSRDIEVEADTMREIQQFRQLLIDEGFTFTPSEKICDDVFCNCQDIAMNDSDGEEAIQFNRQLELEQMQAIITMMFDKYPMEMEVREFVGDLELIIRTEMHDIHVTPKQMLENKLYITQSIIAFYITNINEHDDIVEQLIELKELHVNSYVGMCEWLQDDTL